MMLFSCVVFAAGCGGDDGKDGAPGAPGGGITPPPPPTFTLSNGEQEWRSGCSIPAGAGTTVLSFDADVTNGSDLQVRIAGMNDISGDGEVGASGPFYNPCNDTNVASQDEMADRYTGEAFQVLIRAYPNRETAHPAGAKRSGPYVYSPEEVVAQYEHAYEKVLAQIAQISKVRYKSMQSKSGVTERLFYADMHDGRTFHDVDLRGFGTHAYIEVQINCPTSASKKLWTRYVVERIEVVGQNATINRDIPSGSLLGCEAS